jgi:hypothetical protein
VFQRKILRTNILGIFYPNTISNKDLFEKCKIKTIEHDMGIARWKMLGHTLRMTNKTPAKQAMIYYFSQSESQSFRGHPRTTLPTLINEDIKELQENKEANVSALLNLPEQFKTIEDFKQLEEIAKKRKQWSKIIIDMQTLSA